MVKRLIGSNEKTFLLKNENTYYVLPTEDYLVKNIYYDAKYDGKADLIPVYKEIGIDDMYGFIDKSGSEVIPFIYDFVWNFEDTGFAKVKRFGCIHAVGKDGTLYLGMGYWSASFTTQIIKRRKRDKRF